eukprot:UN12867
MGCSWRICVNRDAISTFSNKNHFLYSVQISNCNPNQYLTVLSHILQTHYFFLNSPHYLLQNLVLIHHTEFLDVTDIISCIALCINNWYLFHFH